MSVQYRYPENQSVTARTDAERTERTEDTEEEQCHSQLPVGCTGAFTAVPPMRTFLFLVVATTSIGVPRFVRSQEVFAGYASFCGLPVIVGSDAQTASARTDQFGAKYIHIDPGAMANWTNSRMFTLAHECAHHLLGHTSALGTRERYLGGTARQELSADCWAARALRRVGYDFDIDRTFLIYAQQGHFTAAGYPSGVERANNIAGCVGGGTSPAPTPQPVCRAVTDWVDQTEWVTRYVNQSVPCSHPWCDVYGCRPMHAFDVIPVPQQVPVTRRVPVTRTVCN